MDRAQISRFVIVPVPVEEAFRLFTELPGEWLPPAHTFLRDPLLIAMEPWAGGRFFERGKDGTEIARGTILEWLPPGRLVVTWRIGPGWQPIYTDEHASVIEIEFHPKGPDASEVLLTYAHMDRAGDFGGQLLAAIESQNPGETLQRFADLAARHQNHA